MEQNKILNQIEQQELSPKAAYALLYPKKSGKVRKAKKAHFIKLRIRVPDSKGASALLAFLFFLPYPIGFVKFILRKVFKGKQIEQVDMSIEELLEMISYKGIKVDVRAQSGERVSIKTI
jgi:hypothetical protein